MPAACLLTRMIVQLCVAVGAAQSLVLLSWTQASRHPQRWRLLALVCAAHGASLLELLDFPPLAGLLDAHALWALAEAGVAHAFAPPPVKALLMAQLRARRAAAGG